MSTEQEQIAVRCRKLATQVDEYVIALRQRGAHGPTKDEALEQLRAMSPLTQALVRYQLALLEYLEIPF